MGCGIAQAVVQSGFSPILFDPDKTMLLKAKISIGKNFSAMVAKNKISASQENKFLASIEFAGDIKYCNADIIIEAIIENEAAKVELFNRLAVINSSDTIFATNTSSLSVSAIAQKIAHPARVAGMHFFNPAPLMKLVEVVKAEQTSEETVASISLLARQMSKTPVVCKDSPGFIVNRVARHYYLEALQLVEHGWADFETIDNILENTGFKMGAFRLMDLIGNDINFAVTNSLYEAFNKPARFKPSVIQKEKLSKGELGRKTGKGYYSYP